jgi:hypothetical protein
MRANNVRPTISWLEEKKMQVNAYCNYLCVLLVLVNDNVTALVCLGYQIHENMRCQGCSFDSHVSRVKYRNEKSV